MHSGGYFVFIHSRKPFGSDFLSSDNKGDPQIISHLTSNHCADENA